MLPLAGPAGINGVAHALQQGLHFLEYRLVAAGHDRQRAGNGHGIAAADGRIQQVHSGRFDFGIQLLNDIRRGGIQIQNDIAGFAVLHGLLDGIDDDGVRGEHLHNDVAGLVDVHRIGGGLAAGSSELIQTGLRHVKAQNRVAALLQHVQGHRQTHNTQTQETNFFHV